MMALGHLRLERGDFDAAAAKFMESREYSATGKQILEADLLCAKARYRVLQSTAA